MLAPDIDLLLRPGAHGRTDASDMIAHTRITERKAPLQKHRVDAATRPLKLAHACDPTHTIVFKTLADNPLISSVTTGHVRAGVLNLGSEPKKCCERLHVADTVGVQTHTLILPHDPVYRVAADVHLYRNLALRLTLDMITCQDLVSFYHSFHFVGPS